MNVVLAVEPLAHKLTGIGRYTWELAQGLRVHPGLDSVRYYLKGQWVQEPASLLVGSVSGERRGAQRKASRFRVPLRWREFAKRGACRGAVFHGPNYYLPSCADIGVVTVHDLSIFKFPETHPPERVRQFEREFADSLHRASHVITDSLTVREELIAWAGLPRERVSAVPLAVAEGFRPKFAHSLGPALQPLGLAPGGYGLCVSTLEPRKQIDRLLGAWRRLPGALRRQYPLVLVGSAGWLNDGLMADIDRGRAEGWLFYLGYVGEAELAALYAGARGFFYPSAYEGFGLPPLEAMACGIPTLVSNQSCLPEVTGGAALQVDPADADAFLAGVQTVLADEGWRETGKIEGLKVAGRYSWQRCVDETVAVYRRALQAG